MNNKVKIFFNISRAYSLPMSIMSFSVPFIFALADGGNLLYGLIALIGIVFAHLGVNMFDDFIDYIIAKKSIADFNDYSKIFQKGKCSYLLDKTLNIYQLLLLIIVCFTLALFAGIFLIFKTSVFVLWIMITAGVLGLLYPFLTYVALGEVTVGVIFAPLMYMGVYYVMTQSLSYELLPLAFSTGMLTIGLLHAHMFFDYDFDKNNKKITLCSLAKSKQDAVRNQGFIYFFAYSNIVYQFCLNIVLHAGLSPFYLLCMLSMPTAFVLLDLMDKNVLDAEQEIKPNIFYGYLGNLDLYEKIGNKNFMIKFMVARNVMVEFTFLLCVAKIIEAFIHVHF